MNWKICAMLMFVSLGAGATQASTHHSSGANHHNQGSSSGSSQIGTGSSGGYMCSGCYSGSQGSKPSTKGKKNGHANNANRKRH